MATATAVFIFLTFAKCILCAPDLGMWNAMLSPGLGNDTYAQIRSLYNNSVIALQIQCSSGNLQPVQVTIEWKLRWTPCANEFFSVMQGNKSNLANLMNNDGPFMPGDVVEFKVLQEQFTCVEDEVITLGNLADTEVEKVIPLTSQSRAENDTPETDVEPDTDVPPNDLVEPLANAKTKRSRRAVKSENVENPEPEAAAEEKDALNPTQPNQVHRDIVGRTWKDGYYIFYLRITSLNPGEKYNASVRLWMYGNSGKLPATDWPLLPFYIAMCVIYCLYALLWFILSACNYKDLLRIQYWIGAVIILGMMEKAVFLGVYEAVNKTGQPMTGQLLFAEIVSCAKRALARMLVVIVSLGFGVVKPRLGPMLHRVILVGSLYFISASVEAYIRISDEGSPNSELLAGIPLAIIDAGICYWVFTSLVQTTRTLRLRRNLVKLSLYRHFTNTLIFAVLGSVAFMIWSLKVHKLASCVTDWKELWVDEAFWHILFCVILLVIMILWRPTNNNQRYAFSPLLDAEDEEDTEPMLNDAFEGMKMRSGTKLSQVNGSPKSKDSHVEEDLKWIEDNIPASLADTALPSLLDSDEEIMTTKFEISKMN